MTPIAAWRTCFPPRFRYFQARNRAICFASCQHRSTISQTRQQNYILIESLISTPDFFSRYLQLFRHQFEVIWQSRENIQDLSYFCARSKTRTFGTIFPMSKSELDILGMGVSMEPTTDTLISKSDKPRKPSLMELPTELHLQITSYLIYPDALSLKHTNRHFYDLVYTGVNLKIEWLIERRRLHLDCPHDKGCELGSDLRFCRGSVRYVASVCCFMDLSWLLSKDYWWREEESMENVTRPRVAEDA